MFFACYHACPGVTANKPVSVRGLPASAPPKSDGTVIKRTWPGGFRSARFAEDRLWPNGKPVPQGCGRKPAPLPQRHVDPRPAGGPKPPASARPAPGGRFSPAGSGAGLPLVRVARVFVAAFRAGGGNAGPFGVPPGGAIPFPGSGSVSRQASGRSAVSAPC
jgi:hypothetical protein